MADSKKRSVTLAHPWTDEKGVRHKPETTLTLDDVEARNLIFLGVAREADKKGGE